jgi:hypothetical protein
MTFGGNFMPKNFRKGKGKPGLCVADDRLGNYATSQGKVTLTCRCLKCREKK